MTFILGRLLITAIILGTTFVVFRTTTLFLFRKKCRNFKYLTKGLLYNLIWPLALTTREGRQTLTNLLKGNKA